MSDTGLLWRHKERGTTYRILGVGRVQCPNDKPLHDDEFPLVYRDVESGVLGIRRGPEFHDGRFEQVAQHQAPVPQDRLAEKLAALTEDGGGYGPSDVDRAEQEVRAEMSAPPQPGDAVSHFAPADDPVTAQVLLQRCIMTQSDLIKRLTDERDAAQPPQPGDAERLAKLLRDWAYTFIDPPSEIVFPEHEGHWTKALPADMRKAADALDAAQSALAESRAEVTRLKKTVGELLALPDDDTGLLWRHKARGAAMTDHDPASPAPDPSPEALVVAQDVYLYGVHFRDRDVREIAIALDRFRTEGVEAERGRCKCELTHLRFSQDDKKWTLDNAIRAIDGQELL